MQKQLLPLLNADLIYASVVGGILHRIYKTFPTPTVKSKEITQLRKTLPVLLHEGAKRGLESIETILKSSNAESVKFQEMLAKSLRQ